MSDAKSQDDSPNFAEECEIFLKAQLEFEPIVFDKVNPHFGSKYTSLASLIKATKPALNKYGITLTSRTRIAGEIIIVETFLVYKGRPFVRSEWPVGKVTDMPQKLGSALTYARRYTLQSVLGIAAEEDDDGNGAQQTRQPKKASPVQANAETAAEYGF